MELDSVGEVIATRRLFRAGDDTAGVIAVKMGKPVPYPDGQDYYCPYQVTGLGDEKVRYAAGIDAFQAMQLALRMIGTDLYIRLNRLCAGRLRWEGDDDGDLGFPPPPARMGPGD